MDSSPNFGIMNEFDESRPNDMNLKKGANFDILYF